MTCTTKDDGKLYPQLFFEEALLEVLELAFYSLNSTIKLG